MSDFDQDAMTRQLECWLQAGTGTAGIVQLDPEWATETHRAASMRFQLALMDAVVRNPRLHAIQVVPYEPFPNLSNAEEFYGWLGSITLLANAIDTAGRLTIRRLIARDLRPDDCFEYAADPTGLRAHRLVYGTQTTTPVGHMSFDYQDFADPFNALNRGI